MRLDRFKTKEFVSQTQQFIDRQICFAFFVGLGFTEPKSKCKSEIVKHTLLKLQEISSITKKNKTEKAFYPKGYAINEKY